MLAITTCGTEAFRNVERAIEYADTHRGIATAVCVAGGNDCNATAAFAGDIVMRDGISVYGSYEAVDWTRCDEITTELEPALASGVVFGSDVQSTTALDGFAIIRPALSETTAVTVDGARGVELSDIDLSGPAAPVNLGGIDVRNGASVTVTGLSSREGASGHATGIIFGVRAVDSLVTIVDSEVGIQIGENGTGYGVWLENAGDSNLFDTFVRHSGSGVAASVTSIRVFGGSDIEIRGGGSTGEIQALEKYGVDVAAATGVSVADTLVHVEDTEAGVGLRAVESLVQLSGVDVRTSAQQGASTGVELDDSPGSSVQGTVVATGPLSTGLSLAGDATGTSIGGEITATGAAAVGVLAESCGGAEPEIRAGVYVNASDGSTIEGVRVLGDCHPVLLDSTVEAIATNTSVVGVRCGTSGGVASRCAVHGSTIATEISQLEVNHPVQAIGVSCEQGGCGEILDSEVMGLTESQTTCARTCRMASFGVVLDSTDALVARNRITSGCAPAAAAIRAAGATSRIVNNHLVGSYCNSILISNYVYSAGLYVEGGSLDVHSNTLDAGGSPYAPVDCWSGAVIGGSRGTYRNNIFTSGLCWTRAAFFEGTPDNPFPQNFLGGGARAQRFPGNGSTLRYCPAGDPRDHRERQCSPFGIPQYDDRREHRRGPGLRRRLSSRARLAVHRFRHTHGRARRRHRRRSAQRELPRHRRRRVG
jgi:hypothetical protein